MCPSSSYTAQLFSQGDEAISRKIMEEATEIVFATQKDKKNEIVHEVADLIFHICVLLTHKTINFSEIIKELKSREGISGLKEKHQRKE